ncbi:Uncharacterised protein [Vibrio cholerae]|nr:Uncharacterised protein [Vibrio cholerae]
MPPDLLGSVSSSALPSRRRAITILINSPKPIAASKSSIEAIFRSLKTLLMFSGAISLTECSPSAWLSRRRPRVIESSRRIVFSTWRILVRAREVTT